MNRTTLFTLLGAGLLSASMATPALADRCPPGLSKKTVACVPPGQVKKQFHKQTPKQVKQVQRFKRGERITRSHQRLNNPEHYGLRADRSYVVVENQVYRIDPDTRAVLNIIGALSQLSQ